MNHRIFCREERCGVAKKTYLCNMDDKKANDGNAQSDNAMREHVLKRVEVVAAILVNEGAVLATQRGYGKWKGYWEFPGGKVESGESHEAALCREIKEEMEADIVVDRYFSTVEYDYPDFHLVMHCFLCHLSDGHYHLCEHLAARWLRPDEFDQVRWLPADDGLLRDLAAAFGAQK